MKKLQKYRKIVGSSVIDNIKDQAQDIRGIKLLHINSTKTGGGVAEILKTLIPLFNELGIKTQWKVIQGTRNFFKVTKNFHNSLQGESVKFTEKDKSLYLNTCKNLADTTRFNHDCVIIHDPQPCAVINYSGKKEPWIWRCHIDLTRPSANIWNFLKKYISMYDHMVVSSNDFIRKDVKIPQSIIMPSIDPISQKNISISENAAKKILSGYNIEVDKPIIAQVSRFDKWKDPMGVIKTYKIIRERIDCKLVLIGSTASDDPESSEIYKKVVKQTEYDDDIIAINKKDDMLVNAIQNISCVILQKSLKEGFGLTVSEALWKRTPVVAGTVGGIRSQIQSGNDGYLVNPRDYRLCAKLVIKLLQNGRMRERMGRYGQEYVRKNFLITRHLLDWIMTIKSVMK